MLVWLHGMTAGLVTCMTVLLVRCAYAAEEVGHTHVSTFCIHSAHCLLLLKYSIVYYNQMDSVLC